MLSLSTMAFSADSGLLYAGNTASLHTWDLTTGREKSSFSHALPSERAPGVVVVSPRGKYLLTGSGGERLVHLWNLADGTKRDLENPARDIGMVSAVFSHDEKTRPSATATARSSFMAPPRASCNGLCRHRTRRSACPFRRTIRLLAVASNDRFHAPGRRG